jgi:hypothetical protein
LSLSWQIAAPPTILVSAKWRFLYGLRTLRTRSGVALGGGVGGLGRSNKRDPL